MAIKGERLNLKINVDVKGGEKFSKITKDAKAQEKALISLNKQLKLYITGMSKIKGTVFPKAPKSLSTSSSSATSSEGVKKRNNELINTLKIEKDIAKALGDNNKVLKIEQAIVRETYNEKKVSISKIEELEKAQLKAFEAREAKKQAIEKGRLEAIRKAKEKSDLKIIAAKEKSDLREENIRKRAIAAKEKSDLRESKLRIKELAAKEKSDLKEAQRKIKEIEASKKVEANNNKKEGINKDKNNLKEIVKKEKEIAEAKKKALIEAKLMRRVSKDILRIERDTYKAVGKRGLAYLKSQQLSKQNYIDKGISPDKIAKYEKAQEKEFNDIAEKRRKTAKRAQEVLNDRRQNAALREIRLNKKLANETENRYEREKLKIQEIVALKKKAGQSDSSIAAYEKEQTVLNKIKNDLSKSVFPLDNVKKASNLFDNLSLNIKESIVNSKKLSATFRVMSLSVRTVVRSVKILRKGIKVLVTPLKIATGLLKKMALIGASFYVAKAFIGNIIQGFGDFFQVGAMFEDTRIKLTALTGSAKEAGEAMTFLRKYSRDAAIDLTAAGSTLAKMSAYGIGTVRENIKYYKIFADTAAATGKTADQVSEAIVDAMQGENERMKELAIRGRIAGDKVVYTYKSITGEMKKIAVEQNPDKILGALTTIMKDKYEGQIEAISRGWNGVIQRIKNTWTLLIDKVLTSDGLFDKMKDKLVFILDKLDGLLDKKDPELFNSLSKNIEGFIDGVIKTVRTLVSIFYDIQKTMARISNSFGGKLFGLDGDNSSKTITRNDETNKEIENVNKVREEKEKSWAMELLSYTTLTGKLSEAKNILVDKFKIFDDEETENYLKGIEEQKQKSLAFFDSLLEMDDNKNMSMIRGMNNVKYGFLNNLEDMKGGYLNFMTSVSNTKLNMTNILDEAEIKKGIKHYDKLLKAEFSKSDGKITESNKKNINDLTKMRDTYKLMKSENLQYERARVKITNKMNIADSKAHLHLLETKNDLSEIGIKYRANAAGVQEYNTAISKGLTHEEATELKILTIKKKTLSLEKQKSAAARSGVAARNRSLSLHKKEVKLVTDKMKAEAKYNQEMANPDLSYGDKNEEERAFYAEKIKIDLLLFKESLIESGLEMDKVNEAMDARSQRVWENLKKQEQSFSNGVALYAEDLQKRLNDTNGMMSGLLNSIEGSINSGFDSLFDGFIDGTKSAKESFSDMAKSILKDLLKVTTKAATMDLMALFTGKEGGAVGKGATSFLSSLFSSVFSADGNAFDNGGKVDYFANGGQFTNSVVNTPTAFPLGVMGEAGPEAIVPLNRDNSGKLGIETQTPMLNQVINNNASGVRVSSRTDERGVNQLTIEEVENHLSNRLANGTGNFNQALNNSYNINRR